MRTTIDLDDDVAAAAQALQLERGIGRSKAFNELARRGIARREGKRSAYRLRPAELSARLDVSNIGEVLETLDEQQ